MEDQPDPPQVIMEYRSAGQSLGSLHCPMWVNWIPLISLLFQVPVFVGAELIFLLYGTDGPPVSKWTRLIELPVVMFPSEIGLLVAIYSLQRFGIKRHNWFGIAIGAIIMCILITFAIATLLSPG